MVKRYEPWKDRVGWSHLMEEKKDGGYVKYENYSRLRDALKLIADGTICPDLFPNEANEDALAAKTAMTIAAAALEVTP